MLNAWRLSSLLGLNELTQLPWGGSSASQDHQRLHEFLQCWAENTEQQITIQQKGGVVPHVGVWGQRSCVNDEHALKNDNVWYPSLRKDVEHNLPFVRLFSSTVVITLLFPLWGIPSALASARGSSMHCFAVGGFSWLVWHQTRCCFKHLDTSFSFSSVL